MQENHSIISYCIDYSLSIALILLLSYLRISTSEDEHMCHIKHHRFTKCCRMLTQSGSFIQINELIP